MNSLQCLAVALLLLFSLPAPYPTSGLSPNIGKPRQKNPCHYLREPTLTLHRTQGAPSWLLRHRKALERLVLSSRVRFHLSSSQVPSAAQGADPLQSFALSHGACRSSREPNPTPCHEQRLQEGEGRQQHHLKTQMVPDHVSRRKAAKMCPFRIYSRCSDLNTSLHSFTPQNPPARGWIAPSREQIPA